MTSAPAAPTHVATALVPAAALLVAAALALLAPSAARAGNPVPALAGLKGVSVSVFRIHDQEAHTIAPEETIRVDVERQLLLAGIWVFPEPKRGARPSPDDAQLWVLLNPLRGPGGDYTYSIDLFLMQPVKLARKPGPTVSAITWNAPSWIGRSAPERPREIRKNILRVVDVFVRAYWDSNPKP